MEERSPVAASRQTQTDSISLDGRLRKVLLARMNGRLRIRPRIACRCAHRASLAENNTAARTRLMSGLGEVCSRQRLQCLLRRRRPELHGALHRGGFKSEGVHVQVVVGGDQNHGNGALVAQFLTDGIGDVFEQGGL